MPAELNTETIDVGRRTISVSSRDKVFFPQADGHPAVTKGQVVDYYARVGELMVPWLAGRPLVMHRFPDGIDDSGFYQKATPGHFPDWIGRVTLPRREGGTVTHVVAGEAATVVYAANQGTIEFHTLTAPGADPEHPAELILDLDPSTDDLAPVVAGARAVRDLLRDLDVVGWVKSTGSRGLHIHVDLDGAAGFDQAREVAASLARAVVDKDPDRFTVAHSKAERGPRLFVDYLRNGYGQHAVAPYSLRARPAAPVAVPLDWDEATSSSFDPRRVRIDNVFRRLGHKADPWDGRGQVRYGLDRLRC